MSGSADHFSEIAHFYRDHRPGYPAALAEWLAAHAPSRALAWEAGCGSGQFTLRLADAFERVHATDASAEQIAQAPAHPRIAYAAARAEASGLADSSVDLVCAAQAAHWFDLPAYYAEASRVARPGALLAVFCYGRFAIAPQVDEAIYAYHDGVAGPHWPRGRAQVESSYRNLSFPFTELSTPEYRLEENWDCAQFLDYAATWSATRRLIAAEGEAPFTEFRSRLATAWGDPHEPRIIRWPVHLRVARLD